MRRYLLVANQTLGGEPLREKVRQCMAQGPSRFHIVVPATPSQEHLTWTEGDAIAIAQGRLDRALVGFGELGAEVTGEVGDGNPLLAVDDAVREGEFHEIILSTLPPGASRWLKLDLPSRLARHVDIPITHVVVHPEGASAE